MIRSDQADPVDPGRDKADEMENNLIRQRPTGFPSHSGTYTLSSPSSLPTSLVRIGHRLGSLVRHECSSLHPFHLLFVHSLGNRSVRSCPSRLFQSSHANFSTSLASKEWVIPAKPKPGRKPKKDIAPPPADTGEVGGSLYMHRVANLGQLLMVG